MKTVFTAAFQEEALVLQSILKSAGIESVLIADRMLDANPLFSIEPKGVQIVVTDGSEEDARAIIADSRSRDRP